jgi:hypothetical protein
VGLPWTSNRPASEASTRQQTALIIEKYPCSRWDSNPQSFEGSGRRTMSYTARSPLSASNFIGRKDSTAHNVQTCTYLKGLLQLYALHSIQLGTRHHDQVRHQEKAAAVYGTPQLEIIHYITSSTTHSLLFHRAR